VKIHSSMIDSLWYSPKHRRLTVRFNNQSTYEYAGVRADTYDQLIQSGSKGKFFHRNIRGKYDYRRK